MTKLSKRIVKAAAVRSKDYFIWDDDLPGFGVRIFASGKRSYLIQYRAQGRSRRYSIGLHGVWTAELARQEAKAGRIGSLGLIVIAGAPRRRAGCCRLNSAQVHQPRRR